MLNSYNLDMPGTRPKPFMEHPTGHFATAVEAMADAIQRLRMLPNWSDWITFCAQGAGQHEDGYHLGEIRMLGKSIDPGLSVDVEIVAKAAEVPTSHIVMKDRVCELPGTTPLEAARVLDAIFRNHLEIRPFADEGDDYAVGAEW
jgi:hypothetical protein